MVLYLQISAVFLFVLEYLSQRRTTNRYMQRTTSKGVLVSTKCNVSVHLGHRFSSIMSIYSSYKPAMSTTARSFSSSLGPTKIFHLPTRNSVNFETNRLVMPFFLHCEQKSLAFLNIISILSHILPRTRFA